jgi:hypothetical protein
VQTSPKNEPIFRMLEDGLELGVWNLELQPSCPVVLNRRRGDSVKVNQAKSTRGECHWNQCLSFYDGWLRAYGKIGNGRVAGDLVLLQGARRENILYGYSTDEQRSSNAKDRQPEGLFTGGCLAALLLSRRALRLSSFVAPCRPPASKRRPHSSFCYKLLIIS